MKRVIDWLLGTALTVVFAVLLFVILIEWFSGCGESWVQADGSRVMGDCVFIGEKK